MASIWESMAMVSGDVDADGDVDCITHYEAYGVVTYVNDGTGRFTRASRRTWIDSGKTRMKLVDLTGDSYPELVAVRQEDTGFADDGDAGSIELYRNNRNNPFGVVNLGAHGAPNQSLAVPETGSPTDVVVADVDKDGRLDIASNSWRERQLLVWRGTGAFAFEAFPRVTAMDSRLFLLLESDIDLDGDLDLVAADDERNAIVTLTNERGEISAPTFYATGNLPYRLGMADFNGDCLPDYYVASSLELLRQRWPQ